MNSNAMEVDTPSWIVSKGNEDFHKYSEEINTSNTLFFLTYGDQLGVTPLQIMSALAVKNVKAAELLKACMEHRTLEPFLRLMHETDYIHKPVTADQEKSVIAAFQTQYMGDVNFFKSHIQLLLCQPSRYTNSFAIIQSSGTGKSRLVDELARQWFTFSLCLRASNPLGSFSWPPPDEEVRDYLGASATDTFRVICFLNALFENAATQLSKLPPSDETLAARWRLYLQDNRTTFYIAVIKMAKVFESENSEASKHDKNLEDSLKRHTERLDCLKKLIREHLQRTEGFPIIIFFDEAHEVGPTSLDHITLVFSELKYYNIVGIYLSTNSLLRKLAQIPFISSERAVEAIPTRPYTELLLNVFSAELGDTSSQLTLDVVRSIKNAACLGRPMWMALLMCGYPIQGIIRLAEKKLCGASSGPIGDVGQYAILACRLLFQNSAAPRGLVAKLVTSHLGFAYFVSQDRSVLHVEYPPEPFVSAAAVRIMTSSGVANQWVSWLQKIIANHWLSREDRGELVSRVVFTLARDRAWKASVSSGSTTLLEGHEPVSLCAFLEQLVGEVPWKSLQNAKPINIHTDSERSIPLGKFVNTSVIDFTCFTIAEDETIFTHRGMIDALLLGAAVVCTPTQRMYDHAIIFLIRPSRGMVKDNIGLILEQVKINKAKINPILDPASLLCGTNFPVISIVHNLAEDGDPHAATPPVEMSAGQEEPQCPHYCLHLYRSPLLESDTVRDLLDADSIPVQYHNSFTQNHVGDAGANQVADEAGQILRCNGFYGIEDRRVSEGAEF